MGEGEKRMMEVKVVRFEDSARHMKWMDVTEVNNAWKQQKKPFVAQCIWRRGGRGWQGAAVVAHGSTWYMKWPAPL